MASCPPYHVEDQTDEDFFDKLVNDDDDDDFKGIVGSSGTEIGDEIEFDEVKAFTDLSTGDIGTGDVGTEQKEGIINADVKLISMDSCVEKSAGTQIEENSTTFGSDIVNESSNGNMGTMDTTSDTITSKSSLLSAGIKEVQWSAFNSYSGQHFISEFGEDSVVESIHENVTDTFNCEQYQEGQVYDGLAAETEQSLASTDYWENLYPGWKYDHNTGQWYQVDHFDINTNVSATDWAVSDDKPEVSNSYVQQQTTRSIMRSASECNTIESVTNSNIQNDTTESVSNWIEDPQSNKEYPTHMVFDPQYPGWYYDMITQEWCSLDGYNASQSNLQTQDQHNLKGYASSNTEITQKSSGNYDDFCKNGSQGKKYNSDGSLFNFSQRGLNMWQPETSEFGGNTKIENHSDLKFSINDHTGHHKPYDYRGAAQFYEKLDISESQGFILGRNFSHHQQLIGKKDHMNVPKDYYSNHNSASYFGNNQFSCIPATEGRSSAGRSPHALVTFGFGGKLILLEDNYATTISNSSYGSKDPTSMGSIFVLNLMEVVNERTSSTSCNGIGFCDYFHSLSRLSFPGPLTGGNVGVKELNKWIDERITHCDSSSDLEYKKAQVLKLLLSLLKISCQHYGKLRSPFGTDTTLWETDAPELAVARLFSSAQKNHSKFSESAAFSYCLQKLPSEGQLLETAAAVQNLLVSGRKKEALHCAQVGQLWGPALVLAAQLGDQFYVDTIKQMALRQLVAGSPLRTLYLLIAGQPAEVFSTDTSTDTFNVDVAGYGMFDDWEANLAMITANRTKDDELVLIHLGDCLWKERSDILAAHICYLVADANFEPYSDIARLCLIGSDHWKYARTYASPEAVQRTEIYEYSKVLGNSQFVLLPFQPYKLIYAHMLAEVGRVSDSLKYCQAILKSLKMARSPEVDIWRQLAASLEERIRTHQEGGFSTNLGPAKLVGKLLNLFDSTAHRVVGGLPPPIPSISGGSIQVNEHYQQQQQPSSPRVSTSQSTMAISALVSPVSTDTSRKKMHNRSISEPDIGRTTIQDQVASLKEESGQNKSSISGSTRFSRLSFGSQLFQKTVGLVLKRQDRQAKLGEANKFYYDEKLKRWIEEGADPPAEEAALPPPPTSSTISNGDYNLKSALKNEVSHGNNGSPERRSPTHAGHSSGIPPIPHTSNQFSARGRTGVRSRYVDKFNHGGGNTTNLFHSPSVPSLKPTTTTSWNPKFFVPSSVSTSFEPTVSVSDNIQQTISSNNKNPLDPAATSSFQKFGSMDDIKNGGLVQPNSPLHHHHSGPSLLSRRTISWSGGNISPPDQMEIKPLGESLPVDEGRRYGEDMHDVQL